MINKGMQGKRLEIHMPNYSRIGSYSDSHFRNYEEQAKFINSLTSKHHKNKKIKFSISVSLRKNESLEKLKYLEEKNRKMEL